MLITTPRGEARVDLFEATGKARCMLALGHGAGGDVHAGDLVAVRDAAVGAGVTVALITQPYRVAGRRSAAPAAHLDEAWLAVMAQLPRRKLPLIVGGRSSGARVACRTAQAAAAKGVVALAFPLHPPGKLKVSDRGGFVDSQTRQAIPHHRPERSRDQELRDCGVPALVVNGDRDPFGVPEPSPEIEIVVIPGARHDLRKDTGAVAEAVVGWLGALGLARA